MDIQQDWSTIRKHFNQCFQMNLHVAIASVDIANNPTVTPIGSLFLNSDQTGFYFEKYPSKLPKHAKANKNICLLAVNSSKWFWLKSLFRNRFKSHPGIKLYGVLGDKREATTIEMSRLRKRMRATNGLKGNAYLWGDMKMIREITFTKAEEINLGKMTKAI